MGTARDYTFQTDLAGEDEIMSAEALDEWLRKGGYHDLPLSDQDRFYDAARRAFNTYIERSNDRS